MKRVLGRSLWIAIALALSACRDGGRGFICLPLAADSAEGPTAIHNPPPWGVSPKGLRPVRGYLAELWLDRIAPQAPGEPDLELAFEMTGSAFDGGGYHRRPMKVVATTLPAHHVMQYTDSGYLVITTVSGKSPRAYLAFRIDVEDSDVAPVAQVQHAVIRRVQAVPGGSTPRFSLHLQGTPSDRTVSRIRAFDYVNARVLLRLSSRFI